jgi:phasin family protein
VNIAQQLHQARLTSVEALFSLSTKALEGVERLIGLNVQATKESMNELSDRTCSAFEAKNLQELLALQASLAKPAAEKAAAYARHLQDIVTSTGTDLRSILQAQVALAKQNFTEAFESVFKDAPAGLPGAISAMKSTLTEGYRDAGQVVDAVDAKSGGVTAVVSKAATRGAKTVDSE